MHVIFIFAIAILYMMIFMFVILPYEMFLFFFCVLYKFVNTSQRVYMIILHDVFLMVADPGHELRIWG